MATSAKENILKRVRQALSNPVPLPFPGSEGASSLFAPPNENRKESRFFYSLTPYFLLFKYSIKSPLAISGKLFTSLLYQ